MTSNDQPQQTNQQADKMTLVFDEIPPGMNGSKGLLRMHWKTRVQYGNRWRMLVRQALGDLPQPWMCYKEPVLIQFTVFPVRPMDEDNVHSTFKLLGDALKHWDVIVDDSPKWVKLVSRQEHAKNLKDRHCMAVLEPLSHFKLETLTRAEG